MLDATKDFHRVHYGKLFNMLVARDMPFVTIRLLLNMYALLLRLYGMVFTLAHSWLRMELSKVA